MEDEQVQSQNTAVSESDGGPPEPELVTVEVSPDLLTASVRLVDHEYPFELTCDAVSNVLKKDKIIINREVLARIDDYLKLLQSENPPDEPFVIARGTPSESGQSEEFVWDEAFQSHAKDWIDDAPVDYYSFNSIITVDADATIGSIKPMVPGKVGTDVRGEPIEPGSRPTRLEIGDSIQRSGEDSTTLIAKVAGRVVADANTLFINEVLSISGDVDFSTGHVDSSIDVHIKGTVHDRFEVKSRKSVTVGGTIEAAFLQVEGDVVVRGGIVSRASGRVVAKGTIVAKFCDEANLHADGDIKIARELMNCSVHTESELLIGRGAIIGGHVYARQGAVIGMLGSGANVATRIIIGLHPRALREIAQIEESNKSTREGIERIRNTVQPLLANRKRLTAEQAEQATELLFKADEAETQVNEAEQRREEILSEGICETLRIRIGKIIHPGATISIGKRVTTVHREIKGPVLIELRKVDKVTELVTLNELTGSITVLPNAELPIEELIAGFEVDEPDQVDEPDSETIDETADDQPSTPPS